MVDTCERFLARTWPFLLGAVLCIALVSCAATHLGVDSAGNEVLVTTGEHIAPGLAETVGSAIGAPVEDIVGAAGDAVAAADVPDIVEDVSSGNWLSAIVSIVGVGLAVFSGVRKRGKLRRLGSAVKRKLTAKVKGKNTDA